ncbi:hypothetical protein [Sediminibacter sp. Hel_I_10]|uniref:hypothetical protein n=1 Tax=Sediminibacter sp. Hel_I_10 TaxID=1392490 RepID=UPI0004788DDC|nr:hypothetical protein [Sediminibacter sp. Hel_I_10]
MMSKKLLFFVCFLILFKVSAQISVGARHVWKMKKFPKGQLDKFKKTETIFILSNIIDTASYQKLLKDSWSVTPYKLVNREDFDLLDYMDMDGNFSFANLEGLHKQKTTKSGLVVDYLYLYINFYMIDFEGFKDDVSKLKKNKRSYEGDFNMALTSNTQKIARIEMFPKDTFIPTALSTNSEVIMDSIYNRDVFYNYKPGFLKNYFQKVNNQLVDEEEYWMYENDFLPELKKLSKTILYIPNYHIIKFNSRKMTAKEDKEGFEEVLSGYDYEYQFQDEIEMDERILSGEEFYYLRFVRVNSQKFVQIVNSKTGEIVYRDYIAGALSSYNLKKRHIKDINDLIKKALKK